MKRLGKGNGRHWRILMVADYAFGSARAVAAGVIRFASVNPGMEVLVHGRTSEATELDLRGIPLSDIDGIVSCIALDVAFMRMLLETKQGVPVVFASASRPVKAIRNHASVSIVCDHAAISDAAAELFMRHGLESFGYLGSRYALASATWDADRRDAFKAALRPRGFRVEAYSPPDLHGDAEAAALAAWLKALPKPCGVLASDDVRAMHTLDVCRSAGIAVPEQVQLVGVDNEEWICEHTAPTLTSIEPDFEGCGHRAAELLLRMMEGGKCAEVETFGVRRVVERMSTTDIHGAALRAVRARRLMREGIGDAPLGVGRIAASLRCSRRTLEASYKAVFGRTVRDDLAELRLERAKRLLAGTDTPVLEIAKNCGLDSPHYLMRLFKARTGMTMLQWRKRGGT